MSTTTTKTRTQVGADRVRAWAREKGFQVGTRGHLPMSVVKAYNRSHRTQYTHKNPFLGYEKAAS